jgi:hypothetical protein
MQESKEVDREPEHDSDTATGEFSSHRKSGVPAGRTSDTDGWQQYRKWISKAPAPRGRRRNVDPSIYTWQGYRTWSEQIKRNWSDT